VNWNQVSTDPSVEPEHPAPVLTITPAAADAGAAPSERGSQDDQVTSQGGSVWVSTLPLVVSGAALVLSLIAVVLARHRNRRPASAVDAAPAPTREDVSV
jgi:periplasmic copper chaperone A